MQKPRKSKKPKKKNQNCRPHWGSCLTLWTCGLQFFLVFWIFEVLAIWSRPCKNIENKKQNCRPHWGSCLTLWTCGLQFFFVFFGFSRFWPSGADHAKTSKIQKNKKTKLQTPLGLLSDSVDMWSAVLFFLFFFGCSRFWPSGADHAKTSKIKKKAKNPKLQTPLGLLSDSVDMWSCNFIFFVFFFDFRGSGHLEQTIQKPRKSKKTKKQKLQIPLGLLSDSVDMWSAGFFDFRGSGHLEQTMQKPRKSKKTKRQKLQTPLGLLSDSVDMWSAVLFFLFFLIFEILAIWSRPCKNIENQKKTKLQTPLGLLSKSVDMWSAVLVVSCLAFPGSLSMGLIFCIFVGLSKKHK